MILAIDPSSTACGYAVFDGERRVEAGVIRPEKSSEREPCRRAYSMSRDVLDLIDEHADAIDVIVVERPPPTQHKRRSNPSAQHQAFGLLMGVLLASGRRVEPVHPATWTHGSDKAARAADVAARHGALPGDKGHDAADAIGLAEWWQAVGRHRAPVVKSKRKRSAA